MVDEISERMEDYLRIIYEIVKDKGYARIKDIAIELNIKPPTVVEMLKKLQKMGLVIYEKYGGIKLTERGMEIAEVIERRHETVRKFLEMLFIPRDIALRDAHILEHGLHPKTILQLNRFIEFITTHQDRPRFVTSWFKKFREYCQEKEYERRH